MYPKVRTELAETFCRVSELEFLEDLKTGAIEGVVWDFGYIDYIIATECNYVKISFESSLL